MKKYILALVFIQISTSWMYGQVNSHIITYVELKGSWRLVKTIAAISKPDSGKIEPAELTITHFEETPVSHNPPHFPAPLQEKDDEIMLFEKDSVFSINYPCALNFANKYYLKHDSLKIIYYPGVESRLRIILAEDTMTIQSTEHHSIVKYIRATPDPTIIHMLKNDTLNPQCLVGEWVSHSFGEYTGPEWKKGVNIPFTPFDKMIISSKNIYPESPRKHLTLKLDGKKRTFRYEYMYGNILKLQLTNWEKPSAEPVVLYFHKN